MIHQEDSETLSASPHFGLGKNIQNGSRQLQSSQTRSRMMGYAVSTHDDSVPVMNEGPLVVLSSPPAMHHPVPARNASLRLLALRSPHRKPGNTESVITQAGFDMKQSHLKKTETSWRKWLHLDAVDQIDTNDRGKSPTSVHSLTPGISNCSPKSGPTCEAENPSAPLQSLRACSTSLEVSEPGNSSGACESSRIIDALTERPVGDRPDIRGLPDFEGDPIEEEESF